MGRHDSGSARRCFVSDRRNGRLRPRPNADPVMNGRRDSSTAPLRCARPYGPQGIGKLIYLIAGGRRLSGRRFVLTSDSQKQRVPRSPVSVRHPTADVICGGCYSSNEPLGWLPGQSIAPGSPSPDIPANWRLPRFLGGHREIDIPAPMVPNAAIAERTLKQVAGREGSNLRMRNTIRCYAC